MAFLVLSPYIISVIVINSWNRKITLQWNDNNATPVSGSHIVIPSKTENITVVVPRIDDLSPLYIQLMESQSGLFIMFPDKKETFIVQPKKFDQKFIFEVKGMGKYYFHAPIDSSFSLVNY